MQRIERLRRKIEKTDLDIIKSLAQRQELVRQIGQIKVEKGMLIVDLEREKKLFEFYDHLSEKYHLQKAFIKRLFKTIINYSRNIQRL